MLGEMQLVLALTVWYSIPLMGRHILSIDLLLELVGVRTVTGSLRWGQAREPTFVAGPLQSMHSRNQLIHFIHHGDVTIVEDLVQGLSSEIRLVKEVLGMEIQVHRETHNTCRLSSTKSSSADDGLVTDLAASGSLR
mmetsp:Transcript_39059/g.59516  ORF Transcript_39059/g.59516 Transcript_39059/m.59516 type:complete len:137 (-) Transcript_39059:2519-2929(-)